MKRIGSAIIVAILLFLLSCADALKDKEILKAGDGRPYVVMDSTGFAKYKENRDGQRFILVHAVGKITGNANDSQDVVEAGTSNLYNLIAKLTMDICGNCVESAKNAEPCVRAILDKTNFRYDFLSDGTVAASDTIQETSIAEIVDCIRIQKQKPSVR